MTLPSPGSAFAVKIGCTCPIRENHYGAGAYGEKNLFFINHLCPIHGISASQHGLQNFVGLLNFDQQQGCKTYAKP